MAKIPLRAYISEIDNLIERGEIEQAVAHARNVLKSYPKHIETYRLLGKAYLESQRYAEAADILQRVLSVFPDDFVSQIGMSIIREDENNMDAAIWHMERAYEVQPFNPAVQDELRRLYGRRDGSEPPKIRLTRGALVRMYTRGDLYPQAIAETRMALAEDPQRLDLQVLLARLYYLSNQKVEAVEVCSSLLSKLPYCYEANQILAEVLPGTSRAEDAIKFKQRIYALEPYAAFLSPTTPTLEEIPDQSVMVEHFVWDSAHAGDQSPDWARTAGVQWDTAASQPVEELPDWINALKPETRSQPAAPAAPASTEPQITADELSGLFASDASGGEDQDNQTLAGEPFGGDSFGSESFDSQTFGREPATAEDATHEVQNLPHAEAGAPTSDEDVVPDWMREAGWAKTDRSADEIAKEELQREAALGIPAEEDREAEQAEIPDWLKSIAPPQAEGTEEAQQRDEMLSALFDEPGSGPQAPSDLFGQEAAKDEGASQEENVPDWLAGLEGESGLAAGAAAAGALPDWLGGDEETPSDAATAAPGIDWEQPEPSLPQETLNAAPMPDWLSELDKDESKTEEVSGAIDWEANLQTGAAEPSEPSASAEIPDWLSELEKDVQPGLQSHDNGDIGRTLPVETHAEEESEPAAGSTPEWLQSIEANEAIRSEETGPTRVSTDWLKSLEREEAQEPTQPEAERPTEGLESEATTEADWLQSLATGTTEGPSAEGSSEEGYAEPAAAEIPEWLQSLEPTGELTAQAAEPILPSAEMPESTQPAGAAAEETAMPDLGSMDMDAAMAWLESLAAKHGADEETLVTPPDQRLETAPDWVQKTTEESTPVAEELSAPTAQIEEQVEAIETAIPEAVAPVQAEEPLPEFLEAAAAPMEPETPLAEETVQPVATGEQPAPDFSDMDSAMAWLETLAAKQGAEEETLITPPDQRLETPPDWVQKEAEEEEAGDLVAESPAEPEVPEIGELSIALNEEATAEPAEVPDWLQSLETTPTMADQETVAEPANEIPDWLAGALEEEPAETANGTAQPYDFSAIPEPPAPAETPAISQQTVEPTETTQTEMPALDDMDAAMAWLESLAAKQGADEETLITPIDQRLETPPDWIAQETPTTEETAQATPPIYDAQTSPEFPDWSEEPAVQVEPVAEEAPLETAEVVEPAQAETVAEPIETPETPLETPAVAEAAAPDFSDMDAAMAWLESLAAKQGADEETLVTPPDQRLETPPEWVQKEAEEGESVTAPSAEAPLAEDWVAAQETEAPPVAEWQEPDAVGKRQEEEEHLPDWLKDMVTLEPAAEEESPAAQTWPESAWVTEEQPAATEAAETDFNWLEEKAPEPQPVEPTAQVEQPEQAPTAEEDMDAAFAWLESLAEKQGAQEGTLITAPEERQETAPEWVQEEARSEPAVSEPIAEETEPVEPAEMPDFADVEAEAVTEAVETTAEAPLVPETPAWQTNERTPDAEEELPDWLRQPEAPASTPSTSSAQTVPDWLKNIEEETEVSAFESEVFGQSTYTPEPQADLSSDFSTPWDAEIEAQQDLASMQQESSPAAAVSTIAEAQSALLHGRVDSALDFYTQNIQQGEHLDETIHDLRDALYRYPVDISIWQALGDAYARNNQLQEALDAYTKAEELLR